MYKIYDKKIIVEDKGLFRCLPLLGWGSQGDVYKIRIGKEFFALKVFNGIEKENIENYESKLDLNIDSYVSPIKLLYVCGRFKGYLMRYCSGNDLSIRKLDIPINEFAESTVKLMEDTQKLSLKKYNIYDAFISNGMYDEGFKMIDIDRYPYTPNKSVEEIEKINNTRLNLFLNDVFERNTGISLVNDKYIKDLIKKCKNGDILFEEVFNIICMMAYNEADRELTNVSEVGKVLVKK